MWNYFLLLFISAHISRDVYNYHRVEMDLSFVESDGAIVFEAKTCTYVIILPDASHAIFTLL